MDKIFRVARKSFSTTAAKNVIQNVTIIGGGAMGSGIAQVSTKNYKFNIIKPRYTWRIEDNHQYTIKVVLPMPQNSVNIITRPSARQLPMHAMLYCSHGIMSIRFDHCN